MMADNHKKNEQIEQEQPAPQDVAGEEAAEAQDAPSNGVSEEADVGWQSLLEVAEQANGDSDDPVVQLVNEYKEAIQARDEWHDKYLRAAAEFVNARRRAEVRADNEIMAARERVLAGILPVLDDFERAFAAIPDDEKDSAWIEGFSLIQRKLQGVLDREGVVEIAAEGLAFDPNFHQAVIMEAAEEAEPGAVLAVLQKGYRLGDRVLRPSMVKVAQ